MSTVAAFCAVAGGLGVEVAKPGNDIVTAAVFRNMGVK